MGNKNLKYCRICYSKKLVRYLNLGKHPFSNSFLKYNEIKKQIKNHKLSVIQLHGTESPSFCEKIKKKYTLDIDEANKTIDTEVS